MSKGRTVMFDSSKYRDVYALDRLCCSNSFRGLTWRTAKPLDGTESITRYTAMTRNLVTDSPDLYRSQNSFLIVFKRKGLKIIKHLPLRGPDEGQFLHEPVTGEQMHHVTFNASAAGLLFDTSTRSVTDYTREYNDQDFYVKGYDIKYVPTNDEFPISGKKYYSRSLVDGEWKYFEYVPDPNAENPTFQPGVDFFESKPLPQRWHTQMLYLRHNTPLERWGNPNNVMSASASMHDNKTVRGDATVIWPRYTMLDFIFEG
jgi:hypothetical protein